MTRLVTYGPLGVVSMFLLWRIREKDREHAAERRADREALDASLRALGEETREGNRELVAIHALLRDRPR